MNSLNNHLRILAVDCCKHVLETLEDVPKSDLVPLNLKEANDLGRPSDVDLIAIGIARYPVRRVFMSQVRRIYPDLPILILRREQIAPGGTEERVRAEFVLSDVPNKADYEVVAALRKVLPFQSCEHLQRDENYDRVQKLIGVLTDRYSDSKLDLSAVARTIRIPPNRLSVILNQHVGVSFRQLLRKIRIEEAKRLLRTRRYSVKEVAALVGFTDSHYFSRSFKEFTGQSAGEYQDKTVAL